MSNISSKAHNRETLNSIMTIKEKLKDLAPVTYGNAGFYQEPPSEERGDSRNTLSFDFDGVFKQIIIYYSGNIELNKKFIRSTDHLKINALYDKGYISISNPKKKIFEGGLTFVINGEMIEIKRFHIYGYNGPNPQITINKNESFISDIEATLDTDEQILEGDGQRGKSHELISKVNISGKAALRKSITPIPSLPGRTKSSYDYTKVGVPRKNMRSKNKNLRRGKIAKKRNRLITNSFTNYKSRLASNYREAKDESVPGVCFDCNHFMLKRICGLWRSPVRKDWVCDKWEAKHNAKPKI